MCSGPVNCLFMAAATLFAASYAAPAPAAIRQGPLPTLRSLQILPRDDPGQTLTDFATLDLDVVVDYSGQFSSCTPQQIGDISTAMNDVRKMATLGVYASNLDLVANSTANFKLFGAAASLDTDTAEFLTTRWFGVDYSAFGDQNTINQTQAIADVFSELQDMIMNDSANLQFNCQPNPATCKSNIYHGGVGISVVGTDNQLVNICSNSSVGPSLERILQIEEPIDGSNPLPIGYSLFDAFMESILEQSDTQDNLYAAFDSCDDESAVIPDHPGDNRLSRAQDIAETCQVAITFSPDNWAGFALEVAMATFHGHTEPLQADLPANDDN